MEEFNKDKKNTPELGSYQFSFDKGLTLRNISLLDLINTENEYVKSDARTKSMNELKSLWNKIEVATLSDNLTDALMEPDKFANFVDEKIIMKGESRTIGFLKKILGELEGLENSLEKAKEFFLNNRIDIETKSDLLDIHDEKEMTDKLDKQIAWIDSFSERIYNTKNYINSKISSII